MKKITLASERTPSVCAHRGFSAKFPENSLEAFRAAVAEGADEIELDVRLTADDVMIISHDDKLERISDAEPGHFVKDSSFEYLRSLNIGVKQGTVARFCTPEEAFAEVGGKVILNIHLKEAGPDGCIVRRLVELAERMGIIDSIYFAGSPRELAAMREYAPQIPRTAIQLKRDTMEICEMVRTYDCARVQLWAGLYTADTIKTLQKMGTHINLYHAETAEEIRAAVDSGVETVLTNNTDIAVEVLGKRLF